MERFHSVPFFWVFFGFGILVAFALFFFILLFFLFYAPKKPFTRAVTGRTALLKQRFPF